MGKFSLAKFFAFLPQWQNQSHVQEHWTRYEDLVVAKCLLFFCPSNHYPLVLTQVKLAAANREPVSVRLWHVRHYRWRKAQAAVRLVLHAGRHRVLLQTRTLFFCNFDQSQSEIFIWMLHFAFITQSSHFSYSFRIQLKHIINFWFHLHSVWRMCSN